MEFVFTDFQRLNGTTWFYLSFLLAVAVFFRFSRPLALRNWDLITLFLITPGVIATTLLDKELLHIRESARTMPAPIRLSIREDILNLGYAGYIWLLAATGYFLVRAVADLFFARRPRIDPNLNISGLMFLGLSLIGFLSYEIVREEPDPAGRASARIATHLTQGETVDEPTNDAHTGSTLLMTPVVHLVRTVVKQLPEELLVPQSDVEVGVARASAVFAHFAILAALILIGWKHFGDPVSGLAMATLYLLLPVTAVNVEKIDHVLPSVFLIWAIAGYRNPIFCGVCFGFAGVFFYPLFLVPIWASFYRQRGMLRFLLSASLVFGLLCLVVWLLPPLQSFFEGWSAAVAWRPIALGQPTLGVWTEATHFYRMPIGILFGSLVLAACFWPTNKNLAHVLALSVAVTLATQFWYPERGGSYIHWYLPMFLVMMFRPNLSNFVPPDLSLSGKEKKAS